MFRDEVDFLAFKDWIGATGARDAHSSLNCEECWRAHATRSVDAAVVYGSAEDLWSRDVSVMKAIILKATTVAKSNLWALTVESGF